MFLSLVKPERPSLGLLWGHFGESKRRIVVVRARHTAHRAPWWRRRAFRDRDEERDPRPGEIVEKRSGRQETDSKSVRAGSLGAQEFAEGGGSAGRVRIEGNRRDAC